jgi:acyl carrier protein
MIKIFSKEILRQELFDLFARCVEPGVEISDQSTLFGDLGLDSLSVMDTVSKIEDRFKVTFNEAELFGISTMKDVYQLAERRLQEMGKLK